MTTFRYGHEESTPLGAADIYGLFNNYRVWKYIIAILLSRKKTLLGAYRILEVGCGGGDKLRFFTQLRAKPENCYGLDTSEVAIQLCKDLSPGKMTFRVGSVLDMPFENHMFDIILCSGLLDCFNDDRDIREISGELSRVLKRDGIVFIIDINENFNRIYGKNEEVMKKDLRPFDSKKGELDLLLSKEFSLLGHMYIFGSDFYYTNDRPTLLPHLPLLEIQMDREEHACSYSLWTFFKKSPA